MWVWRIDFLQKKKADDGIKGFYCLPKQFSKDVLFFCLTISLQCPHRREQLVACLCALQVVDPRRRRNAPIKTVEMNVGRNLKNTVQHFSSVASGGGDDTGSF